MSREVVEETLLILQENKITVLELVDAVSKWMLSVPELLQRFWFVYLRLEK